MFESLKKDPLLLATLIFGSIMAVCYFIIREFGG